MKMSRFKTTTRAGFWTSTVSWLENLMRNGVKGCRVSSSLIVLASIRIILCGGGGLRQWFPLKMDRAGADRRGGAKSRFEWPWRAELAVFTASPGLAKEFGGHIKAHGKPAMVFSPRSLAAIRAARLPVPLLWEQCEGDRAPPCATAL